MAVQEKFKVDYSGPFIGQVVSPWVLSEHPLLGDRDAITDTLDTTFQRCSEYFSLKRPLWVKLKYENRVRLPKEGLLKGAAYNRSFSAARNPDIDLELYKGHADFPDHSAYAQALLDYLPFLAAHEYGHIAHYTGAPSPVMFWDELTDEAFAMHFQEQVFPGERTPHCEVPAGGWPGLVKAALEMDRHPWVVEGASTERWSERYIQQAQQNRERWIEGTEDLPRRALYGVAAYLMDRYRQRNGKQIKELVGIRPAQLREEAIRL